MRVLIAVPALNEAGTVAGVVAELKKAGYHDIVVVDDGSTDETGPLAQRAGAWVLQMPFNVGVGGAMRAAFCFAMRHDYDAMVQVDADGQHDPGEIAALLAPLRHGANIVVGARFERGYDVGKGRRVAMRVLAWGASRLTGTRLSDTTSGFRSADRAAMAVFAERYPAEYLGDTTESLVVAARHQLRIVEVNVHMRPRQGGQRSQGPVRSTLYVGRVLLALAVAAMASPDQGARK